MQRYQNQRRRGPAWRAGRRRLLAGAGALGASGLGLIALACGGGDSGATGATGAANAGSASAGADTAPQPKRGGTLTQRINSETPILDPHQALTTAVNQATAPLFNQLLQYDPAKPEDSPQTIVADLATRWEQPDATTLSFTLKPGVKFHDGSDFSSADVRANIEWFLSPPQGKAAPRRELLSSVESVGTPDASTVVLKLKRPTPSLVANLATQSFAIGQGKEIAAAGGISQNPIGTGPFKFKAYEKSNFIEVERNPSYHVAERPYLDGSKLFIMPNQDSAKASFLAGQLHMYFASSRAPDDMDEVKSQLGSKAETVAFLSPSRAMIFTNARRAPFNDLRVRQAIGMIVDRKAASQVFTTGISPAGAYMMPTGAWAVPEADFSRLEGYTKPDVAGAKRLLAAAGVTDPEWTLTSVVTFQAHAEFVQDQLNKAGVKTKLNILDIIGGAAALDKGDFELAFYVSATALDDPDATFGELAVSNGSRNWSKVIDERIDALYAQQSQQLAFEDRKKTVNEIERRGVSLYQMSTLYFHAVSYARWKAVRNYTEHVSTYSNTRMEGVWLDA